MNVSFWQNRIDCCLYMRCEDCGKVERVPEAALASMPRLAAEALFKRQNFNHECQPLIAGES